jgi:hypothetical protein
VALLNSRFSGGITLLITFFSLSLPAYAQYSGGTGEPNDPYKIATVGEDNATKQITHQPGPTRVHGSHARDKGLLIILQTDR